MEVKILSAKFDLEDGHKLEIAKQHGAYGTLDKLFAMKPEEVIEEVEEIEEIVEELEEVVEEVEEVVEETVEEVEEVVEEIVPE